jgi:hypothetical protein
MTKKAALWTLLLVLSLASGAFSWRYFTRAFPLLSIDISMDRQAALARARMLASERSLGPADYRDAASFGVDQTVQTFVELEGGGKPAFAALAADRLYAPYLWRVRHFKELEKNEVTLTFAPDGTSNGFVERLREDAPGAALASAEARGLAESTAARVWNVDLAPFQAVEQSQERRPVGRVDHTFVYERADRRLGEGRFRLRLVVSGDKLTEVTYFIKVPDAFSRRYEQMRSVNTAIGVAGSLAFIVLYVGGGIAFGLFVLARERWVIWRQPVIWGVIVSLVQTAARINESPLAWMGYDTALSTRAFVAQMAALAVAELVTYVVLFSLSFMAAESLSRRAFPHLPQFWKVWGPISGRSSAVLSHTAAAYLLVPIFVAYEVALYLFATQSLGWWTPSETLFNPDVLASYAPWLSAIARSFQAGFWEEALFRAIPIAGAALIGDRLGNRRAWITAAFIVQAIIFGAGHAPYPTQPAYARPVELILPSIGFGLLYLKFGLLPGVILHFAFDAFWFAMPLFATTAPGIRVQQIAVVVMTFVPIWVLVARRAAARGRTEAAPVELNAAWQPEPIAVRTRLRAIAPAPAMSGRSVRWIVLAGAIGAVAWTVAVTRLPIQRHFLRATRSEASSAARLALAAGNLGPQWRFHPVVQAPGGPDHRFVWETAGRSTYGSLLGTYLTLPGWRVLVRTFEGDVAERAESWTVEIDSEGSVQRVSHELPESRSGPSLDEGAARQLVRRAIADRFAIDAASLKEISAVPSKLPQRTDWLVTFAQASPALPRGELRLSGRLRGDEITDLRRFVFIPEDWLRAERNAQTLATVVQGAGVLFAVVMAIAGMIAAIVSWSRRQFSVRLFLAVSAAFLSLSAVSLFNNFPALLASLQTAQPLQLQLAVLIASSAVGLLVQAAALGLIAGAVPMWSAAGRLEPRIALAVGLALGAAAAAAIVVSAMPGSGPMWPSYAGATAFVPLLSAATTPVAALILRITMLMLIVATANRMSDGWTRRRVSTGALLLIVGGVLGNAGSPLNLAAWIASAAIIGALLLAAYVVVLRHHGRIVPFAAALLTTAATLREGWTRAYPGVLTGVLIACIVMWVVAIVWFRALDRLHRRAAERPPSPLEAPAV